MADVKLELTAASGNYTANIQIIDDPGPLNTWKSLTAGAFTNPSGTFTNLANTGHARGCGVMDCWTLDAFDIDTVSVGDMGNGTNADAGGDFPVGRLSWEVIS